MNYENRLKAAEWEVRPISLRTAQRLVEMHHYSGGGSNTAVYTHGLFQAGEFWEENCYGCTWWIPPTKTAAMATYPDNWQGVLALSRMVVVPDAPKNSASFLLGRSMRLIDRKRWLALVTYADTWQGHKGTIYKSTNWTEMGLTNPERVYTIDGRMVSRKAGPKTRTHSEMMDLGALCMGKFAKLKFTHVVTCLLPHLT